jgi:hypothetical protein
LIRCGLGGFSDCILRCSPAVLFSIAFPEPAKRREVDVMGLENTVEGLREQIVSLTEAISPVPCLS